jgi:[protein-PII] uridylyltransferase
MPPSKHSQKVTAHADKALSVSAQEGKSHAVLLAEYKAFLKKEEHRVRLMHKQLAAKREGGLAVASMRSEMLDVVLGNLFQRALTEGGKDVRVALVASGGYGRGYLNPGSDLDLQFLHHGKVTPAVKETIESVLYMLWDVGFKVGQGVRSLKETYAEANRDMKTKSSLMETRFITGDRSLYDDFLKNYRKECITGKENAYLEARRQDLIKRHTEHFGTFLVKEPHIKNGAGGLRDYHSILWVCYVKAGTMDLDELVKMRIITSIGAQELRRAFDFLMLVRNDLHYTSKPPSDNLTLRAQGLIARNLNYAGHRITQRTELLMKDYYHHTRNIYQHCQSLMQRFELEVEQPRKRHLIGFLARKKDITKREKFDGFYSQGEFIFPEHPDIFKEDPSRLMRMFQHTQLRHLRTSPIIRQMCKESWPAINKTFQYKKANRETFEAILSRRGDVARTLRQMHRVGFLGRYLPEFGGLTDLVQHEFFHQFTADEHTLQTIEKLDQLSDTTNHKLTTQQEIFHKVEDPFVLYLALIMHDTGRSENVRQHSFASEELTDKVCRRLQITPTRRRMLMFLVGHHLTLWQTATTRDLDDPSVIAQFASIVKSKEWLDALFIMTFADASATYEHGWSDWKDSLLRQLYRNTVDYLRDQDEYLSRNQTHKVELRQQVEALTDSSYTAEIAAHFDGMPERYFRNREASVIYEHLRQFRKFFRQLAKDDPSAALTPVLKWTALPDQGCSQLMLISWDRHLLLAKIAGALSAQNINILSADLFLRKDQLVLDIFRVCTTKLAPVTDSKTIEGVAALVEKTFTGKPVSFDRMVDRNILSSSQEPPPEWQRDFPAYVYVTNKLHPDYTMVEVQAVDRIGLLYDIFTAIGTLALEVTHARINTEKGAAIDSFCLTDMLGKQVSDPVMLKKLHTAVNEAIGVKLGEDGLISG